MAQTIETVVDGGKVAAGPLGPVLGPAGVNMGKVVAKLNEAVVAALQDREVRARVLAVGADPAPSTPAEFSAFIKAEIAKWAKVVADTGAKAN